MKDRPGLVSSPGTACTLPCASERTRVPTKLHTPFFLEAKPVWWVVGYRILRRSRLPVQTLGISREVQGLADRWYFPDADTVALFLSFPLPFATDDRFDCLPDCNGT